MTQVKPISSSKKMRCTVLKRETVSANGTQETASYPHIQAPATILGRLKKLLPWPGAALYALSKHKTASYTLPNGATETYTLTEVSIPAIEVVEWLKSFAPKPKTEQTITDQDGKALPESPA